nr:hypothetical protein [Rice orange leaf phytoplasma]
MTKNKKIILIIWGLFISLSVIGLLILLLLSLESKQSQQSFNQPVEAKPIQSSSQQEQETYNAILNKIDKEVDKLTKPANRIEKINYPDGTLHFINEYDSKTGKMVKQKSYRTSGTLECINEYDSQKGFKFKSTNYYSDGKQISLIREFDSKTGHNFKTTYYNPDGTVKEEKTF